MYTLIIRGGGSEAEKALKEKFPTIRAVAFKIKGDFSETHFHVYTPDNMGIGEFYIALGKWQNEDGSILLSHTVD